MCVCTFLYMYAVLDLSQNSEGCKSNPLGSTSFQLDEGLRSLRTPKTIAKPIKPAERPFEICKPSREPGLAVAPSSATPTVWASSSLGACLASCARARARAPAPHVHVCTCVLGACARVSTHSDQVGCTRQSQFSQVGGFALKVGVRSAHRGTLSLNFASFKSIKTRHWVQ